MLIRLMLLFIGLPLAELFLLLYLAKATSIWATLILVIVTGVVGTFLAKRQGLSVLFRVRSDFSQGRLPAEALVDGALILLAGGMLMTPGLITDALGFSLLIPASRNWFKHRTMQWAKQNVTVSRHTADGFYRSATHSEVIESHVVDREGNVVEDDNGR
ncbi:MAG: FxsA family protein [Pirellulaceae bacterium]